MCIGLKMVIIWPKVNVKLFRSTQSLKETRDFNKLFLQSAGMKCSPLCRWGRVVPAWPWQSCPCRWFLATDSYRCGAGRLMWSWRRSSDIAACLRGPMAWTPKEGRRERERRCELSEWVCWRDTKRPRVKASNMLRGEKKWKESLCIPKAFITVAAQTRSRRTKKKSIETRCLQKEQWPSIILYSSTFTLLCVSCLCTWLSSVHGEKQDIQSYKK